MDQEKTYIILDKISPRLRNILSFLLVMIGYALQTTGRSFFIGLPFLIGCFLINLIKGVSIKSETSSEYVWEEVTPERIELVYQHCQKIKKFKSAGIGCFIGLIFSAVFLFSVLAPALVGKNGILPFGLTVAVIDTIILFAGLFVSGNKSAWMPNNMDVKTAVVRRLINLPVITKDPSLKVAPFLEIGKTKTGSFPHDTRMLVKFTDAPEAFIGVQGQISINTVKSTVYPYFYTVIIAKHEFDLFKKLGQPELRNITIENKKTEEVDVVVIRQTTTKTSGYHSDDKVQDYILENSISLAKKMLNVKPKS
ncbi:MAG TPA: hypothetical protein VF399_07720 [bacterium]